VRSEPNPLVLYVLDRWRCERLVTTVQPIHQATDVASLSQFKHFDRSFASTTSRTEGTDILLAAARRRCAPSSGRATPHLP
jgi:hypothetical protein